MIKTLAACLLAFSFSANAPAAPKLPNTREYNCLVKNIYYEARGESKEGKEAVGLVTLNRLRDPRYPKTICKVVYQPGQFSWTADAALPKKIVAEEWILAMRAATAAYNSASTFSATHFHNISVRPKWKLTRVAKIGNHIFYA